MPPETITTSEAGGLLDRLPPELVGPVILGLIVWWMTRAAYRETSKDRGELLDRLEARLDQTERTLAAVSQHVADKDEKITELTLELADLRAQLAASQAAEHNCITRMERLEARYEARIAELEHEIEQLRGDISEPWEGAP